MKLPRSQRKAIVSSVLSPYFTAKKDKTIITQYRRIKGDRHSRIRTVLSPVVTSTGRLASGESFVDPHSTNLQNLSKKESYKDELYRVRDCFIADPGMTFVACDFDKAEAVVAMFESENWDFYQKLIDGEDVHKFVAAHAYHSGNQKSVLKTERQRCKNVLYASFYMAGIPKITATINADATSPADRLTQAEVQTIYDTIMALLNLEGWWDRVWKDLMDPQLYGGVRWLENALGFRRMFYDPDPHDLHKKAVNFFPQTTVASRADEVMIEAFATLQEPGQCEFLLQVHDELMFQVAESKALDYARKIIDLMQSPFTARGRSVYIPASCAIGRRWDTWRGPEDDSLDPTNTLHRMVEIDV